MSFYAEIEKRYKGFYLKVRLEHAGQCLGILGASGCGKSMTLKCVAGIEKPDRGEIVLNGRVLFDSEKKINLPPQKRNIGYLFQNYALFPNMTVGENIGIAICKNPDRNIVVEKLIRLLQLQGLKDRYPMQLSGGQQQRAALARILAYGPELLLLDEPFSALDSFLKEQLQQDLLPILNGYGKDIILVSHNRDEIYRFCDKTAVLAGGRLVTAGDTQALFRNPVYEAAARLTGCKNISRAHKITDYEVEALDWDIRLKTDRFVDEDIAYVGIRAHDIRAGAGKQAENTFAVGYYTFSEEPFENNLILARSGEDAAGSRIWWKVSKEYWGNILNRQIPEFISLPGKHLLLLK